MDLGLKGKYALVTGGSRGIGRAIALALAEEGCHVAICARGKEGVEATVKALGDGGHIGVCGDVTASEDLERIWDLTANFWHRLDILVNSVGGGGRWGSGVLDTPEQTWVEVYEKNVLTAIRFTLRALPMMVEQGWGRVVTIASIYGREVGEPKPWFHVAKSGEVMLMKGLARDFQFARKGITFNTVAPGPIMIPGTGWDEEAKRDPLGFQDRLREFPQRRLGTPEEVASVVAFLCSQKASHINGACVTVDGGYGRAL